jgi:hypothetical protein
MQQSLGGGKKYHKKQLFDLLKPDEVTSYG